VISRDKASSSANQEPSNIRHPSEPQHEVIPNSTNEVFKLLITNCWKRIQDLDLQFQAIILTSKMRYVKLA